jgi:hypothetical protein
VDDLQRLLDIEAIKRVKARYFRFIDEKSFDEYIKLFTDDAVLKFDLAAPSAAPRKRETLTRNGKKEIAEQWQARDPDMKTVHHVHAPEIDILSDTEAKGIWAMEDIVEYPDSIIHGYGHYRETYRKVDGEWLIADLHLTRLRVSQFVKDHANL